MVGNRDRTESRLRQIVEDCLRRSLRPDQALPSDDVDWIASDLLDSMGHVDVLLSIERAAGLTDFFSRVESAPPTTTQKVLAALQDAVKQETPSRQPQARRLQGGLSASAEITGWGFIVGAQRVEAASVEREFSLPTGTIRERAGIECVARASGDQSELSLATAAANAALERADVDAGDLDWLLAASETSVGFPSLGSLVHSRLLLRDSCGVLDLGGACVGLLNALAIARSLLTSGVARHILVVTSDVHSQYLLPGRVAGEFGGLFGDGASAFILCRTREGSDSPRYRLGEFQFGCAGTFSSALAIRPNPDGTMMLKFEGDALARAAVNRLEKIVSDLEVQSGHRRQDANSFATHQPNPRLVEMLARQSGVPPDKFPVVAKVYGNLGCSTCGVALCMALGTQDAKVPAERGPIFMAAVGPGMLWGGGVVF
ncbi:MAG: 3-oxoacyl-ACP synthase III family protein [Acidobacteria bacterium]|nr:3-oxoacyl-ACP synthase III family protein [Acidobacteriota bacterium]MBI3662577.1 3-oxoacyl-ACP synthase III family protein [Acidobacteriota bacterium]